MEINSEILAQEILKTTINKNNIVFFNSNIPKNVLAEEHMEILFAITMLEVALIAKYSFNPDFLISNYQTLAKSLALCPSFHTRRLMDDLDYNKPDYFGKIKNLRVFTAESLPDNEFYFGHHQDLNSMGKLVLYNE